MKVSPIALSFAYTNKKLANQYQSQFVSSMSDSFSKTKVPSFSANDRYFKNAEDKEINGFWDYRQLYYDLINDVYSHGGVEFHEGADFINNRFSFEYVIKDLCHPAPWGYETTLVNKAKENPLTVVSKNGKPLISIKVNAPHRFIDVLTGNEDTLNTRIVFHNPNKTTETIEFGLDKDGDFLLEKSHDEITIWKDSWKLKMHKVHNSDYSGSKTIHYDEDGNESFWKNLF